MRLRNPRQFWRQCQSVAASSVAIALVTFVSYKLHLNNATVVLLYLLVVVLESLAGGAVTSLIVAVLAAACTARSLSPAADESAGRSRP
jgi:K+-sensing histidine kinase KdpD